MTTTRIRRCGEAALLLECADLAEAVALAEQVERSLPEAVDVVAAARTVLVTARDAAALPGLRRRLEALLGNAARAPHTDQPAPTPTPTQTPQNSLPGDRIRYPHRSSGSGGGVADFGEADAGGAGESGGAGRREVWIDVRYDGPDLPVIADLAGMSVEALVRRHSSITWRAAFGGFAPGFFYLVDARELAEPGSGAEPLPPVPRLGSPRTRVPAGSVGLADRFCAVYPGASPGGWQLIGTTDAPLWDTERPDPALLAPGVTVRFRDAGSSRGSGSSGAGSGSAGESR